MHYEYQGQHYEIDTTDPAVAKQKILAHLGQAAPAEKPPSPTAMEHVRNLGRSAVSLADTGLNAITGALDVAAYPLARAYYGTQMSPQEAAQRAEAETTSPKDILGHAMGIVNSPAYQNEASRRIMGTVGQGVQAVTQPIAQATGMPQQDINSLANLGMMAAAPAVGRAGSAVGRAAYSAEPYVAAAVKSPVTVPVAAAKGVVNFGKGALEGIANPEYNPSTSAMVPLQETYYPQAAVQRYMGQMPGVPPQTLEQLQSQARPTSELINDWRTQTAAKLAPKTAQGEPLVPLAGRGIEAAGERVARGYMQHPITGISDLLSEQILGFPVTAVSRMAQNAGSSYLGHRANFAPGFVEKMAAEGSGNVPPTAPTGGAAPVTPPLGPSGPPTAANYMQRMSQLAEQFDAIINPPKPAPRVEPTMGPGPITAPTPAQVNLRQQLNQPPSAPPDTMGMMTNELPTVNERYAGTPNYKYGRMGHEHGSLENPLTPQEAQTWQIQHSLTGEPHDITFKDPTGVVKSMGVSKQGHRYVDMPHANGGFTRYISNNGQYLEQPYSAIGEPLELKSYTERPKHFPKELGGQESGPVAPGSAPPNVMGMMTNENMPTMATRYEGTPNYKWNEWHGHVHGNEQLLTPEEANTWRIQHSLTGEPYTIGTVDVATGVPKEVLGNSPYGDTVLGVLMDVNGNYTQYRLHSDGTYSKAYSGKTKLIRKEYNTLPKDFPDEFRQ